MDANRVTRGLALTSLLLGVGNLLLVGYSIATYEAPPDDGGTSIVGLIWVIYMVLAGLVMADGGIAALFLRYVTPSRWANRLVAVGLVASSVAGLGVAAFQLGPHVGVEIPVTIGRVFVLGGSGGILIGLGIVVQFIGRFLE